MANVYSRVQKISDVVGRSSYISKKSNLEQLVLSVSSMKYDWQFYHRFEKENKKSNSDNNEARELTVALPNDLDYDHEKLRDMCDEIASEIIGDDHDFEYAVHWNEEHTNLHVHFLFSERELGSGSLVPKRYKRDIWMDKDTHQLAKANSKNAELVHKKGELITDKNGELKMNWNKIEAKDPKFKSKEWLLNVPYQIQKVFLNNGFQIDVHDIGGIYIPQTKIGVNSSPERTNNIQAENVMIKEYNASLDEALERTDSSPDDQRILIREARSNRTKFKKAKGMSLAQANNVMPFEHWLEPVMILSKYFSEILEHFNLSSIGNNLLNVVYQIYDDFNPESRDRGQERER